MVRDARLAKELLQWLMQPLSGYQPESEACNMRAVGEAWDCLGDAGPMFSKPYPMQLRNVYYSKYRRE
jgi:hypothetical protein